MYFSKYSLLINRIKFWKNKKDFYKYLYTQPESVERNNFQTDLDEYKDIPKLSQSESNSIEDKQKEDM